MGQAMTSETLSISGGDGYRYWVGLTMKPFKRGCKKTMYKGVLLGTGPRQWEKVVAKAFTDIAGTKQLWTDEVQKSYLTKQLAAEFINQCPGRCKIRVVLPGIVQMDKVSNVNKWLVARKGKRGLDPDEWISIEELIPGTMVRYCPWTVEHHMAEHAESQHLQTFSHFTYKCSNGELVACDFQGVCQTKDSLPYYIFTDSTVHSRAKNYGLFDKGEYGITEFFKLHRCTNICKDWPKPTPLTPPPSFSEACSQRFHQVAPSHFENIIFPASSLFNIDVEAENIRQCTPNRATHGSRRRHASDHQTQQHSISHDNSLDLVLSSRRMSSSNYNDVQGLNLAARNEDSQPPAYDSIFDLSESNDRINRSGQWNAANSHPVLSSSSSCPMLDVTSTNTRPILSQWHRSRTCDEPVMSEAISTELISEESRLRSNSETNMSLQQRRLAHNMQLNVRERLINPNHNCFELAPLTVSRDVPRAHYNT